MSKILVVVLALIFSTGCCRSTMNVLPNPEPQRPDRPGATEPESETGQGSFNPTELPTAR